MVSSFQVFPVYFNNSSLYNVLYEMYELYIVIASLFLLQVFKPLSFCNEQEVGIPFTYSFNLRQYIFFHLQVERRAKNPKLMHIYQTIMSLIEKEERCIENVRISEQEVCLMITPMCLIFCCFNNNVISTCVLYRLYCVVCIVYAEN